MKKALPILLLLLLFPCVALADDDFYRSYLPQDMAEAVDAAYPGWNIPIGAAIWEDEHGALLILRNGTRNAAVIVERTDSGAQITAASDGMIPDSEEFHFHDWWLLDKWDTGAPFLWYEDPDNRYLQYYYVFEKDDSGAWIVSTGFFQNMEEILNFGVANGGTALGVHQDTPNPEVFVPLAVDLRFDTFAPDTVLSACREAMLRVNEPLLIPSTMEADALPQGTVCALADDTAYPVYAGPGEPYARLGENGDAAVTGESWVQVFGRDGDWLLIQYSVPEGGRRFGYVTADAVADADQFPALSWTSREATVKGPMTDDPLRRCREVLRLYDEPCVVLATMYAEGWAANGGWHYIETGAYRGFVYGDCLTFAAEPSDP